MFALSVEPFHRVLCLKFTGLFTIEDLASIDAAVVGFLGTQESAGQEVRSLYDMTGVRALAVPQTRFAERSSKAAIGGLMRVVVPPPWAGEDFGQTYRQAKSTWPHEQPIIVRTLQEAYVLLGIVAPHFEPLA